MRGGTQTLINSSLLCRIRTSYSVVQNRKMFRACTMSIVKASGDCPAGVVKLVHDGDCVACKIEKPSYRSVQPTSQNFSRRFLVLGQHHTFLWHSMGTLRSKQGIHQRDTLGPLWFCTNLHESILADPKDAVKCAINPI